MSKAENESNADTVKAVAIKPVNMQEREKVQREILNTIRRSY